MRLATVRCAYPPCAKHFAGSGTHQKYCCPTHQQADYWRIKAQAVGFIAGKTKGG